MTGRCLAEKKFLAVAHYARFPLLGAKRSTSNIRRGAFMVEFFNHEI